MFFFLNYNNIYFLIISTLIFLIKFSYSSPECIKGKNFCKECNISTNICQICSNFSLYPDQNGGCSLSKHCSISKDGICLICENGFYLSDDNHCSKINFCLKTDKTNSNCLICKPGFILTTKGECSFSENCLRANPKTGLCIECIPNYYYNLDNYECYSNIENDKFHFCLKALNNKCLECIPSYYLGLDEKCVNTKNCKISKKGICTNCTSGYHLSILDTKCVEAENCLYANANMTCEECKENHFYDKSRGQCILRDDKNSNLINCKIVSSKNDCYRCNKDHYLNMTDLSCYKNTEINNKFFKCAKTDNKVLNCEQCVDKYYLGSKNKKCSEIYGCALYEDNQCVSCEENFCHDLKSDLCYPKDVNAYINNKDYNKFCINCKETNDEGTSCNICDDGFIVGENGACINTFNCDEAFGGKCLKCKDNYCLNKNNICNTTEINNCLKCEKEDIYHNPNKICTECNPGFVLNENNICLKCGYGCKKCSNENICLECFDGYYLAQNNKEGDIDEYICKKCKTGCKTCLNENECVICEDNYYEEKENDEIKCSICPEGCDDCLNKFNCIKCKDDYKLVNIQEGNYCVRTKKRNE